MEKLVEVKAYKIMQFCNECGEELFFLKNMFIIVLNVVILNGFLNHIPV